MSTDAKAGDLAAVVLAAGRGSRLSPLTDRVPKPLLTVDNREMLAAALDRVASVTDSIAVNAHHLADQIAEAARRLRPGVHVSFERERLLGTAGALWQLRDWIAGRPVLVTNSDMWLSGPIDHLLDGWDGTRPRLLVTDLGRPADFGTYRFVGASLVPAVLAARLQAEPDGLYEAVWRAAHAAGELEFVLAQGEAFDCGTPAEFIHANLRAAGARAVIAPDAHVHGEVDRSVVLSGGVVAPGERLVGAIRDRYGNTMSADLAELAAMAG